MAFENYFSPLCEVQEYEAKSSRIFDKICEDLCNVSQVYLEIPNNTFVRKFLLQMINTDKFMIQYFRIICPVKQNTQDQIPKEFLNNPGICTCNWTALNCQRGLMICISKSN